MRARGLSEAAIGAFKGNFDQLVAGATGMVRAAAAPAGWLVMRKPCVPRAACRERKR
jgi:hypothetical protein